MELSNTTYVTDVNRWELGPFVRQRKRALQDRPDALLQNEYFTFTRIHGEYLGVEEFDIGSKFGEYLASASLRGGESLIVPLEGQLDVRRYRARFGRKYTHPQGYFNLLIPEDKDFIYVVQELTQGKSFVQWANHRRSRRGQEIMENGEYALFQNANSPVLPLVAIISGLDILIMGESLTGSTGYYREISRAEPK